MKNHAKGLVFGRTRPSHGGKHPIHITPPPDTHYRDLPKPTGSAPYQLDLKSIISSADYQAIKQAKKLTFHVNGDMGGLTNGMEQQLVAKGMEADFSAKADGSENPAFLYVCGDCVYYNGEIAQYYAQYYEPYDFYPGPIFAVPGNHDGENLPTGSTLDGFMRNFCCASAGTKTPEAQSSGRTAMVQPNVYWTLLTPMANFIGLYTNVPAGGEVRPPQTEWLIDQLKTLPTDRPLFVTMHHPIYSADDHHSGSTIMKTLLETAATKAGRHPDMLLAGHVHNYQRLTKNMSNGVQVPYIVAGAGGYYNLHHIMSVNGQTMVAPVVFKDKGGDPVTLEKYSDDHHGFLRMEIDEEKIVGKYYTVPRPQESYSKGAQLLDYFEFDWVNKKYVANHL